jgi:hypothetical protein
MKKTKERREVYHEYWKGDRRAHVIYDSAKGWECEFFKDDGWSAYLPLHRHSESYAESAAENFVEGTYPITSEHLTVVNDPTNPNSVGFYGYNEKTDNFDPEVDD